MKSYDDEIHAFGRFSTITAIILMFSVPFGIMLYYDVNINWTATFAAALQLCIVFIPTNLIEVISFSPILGSGGTYLSFITGNVMNMKLPAATSALHLAEVEPHSDEGEVVLVLSIGASSITTTIIVFVGMLLLAPLTPILQSEFLKPAFSNIMPALLGTMLFPAFLKTPKYAIVPLILSTLAGVYVVNYGANQGYLLICIMIISVIAALLLQRKEVEV